MTLLLQLHNKCNCVFKINKKHLMYLQWCKSSGLNMRCILFQFMQNLHLLNACDINCYVHQKTISEVTYVKFFRSQAASVFFFPQAVELHIVHKPSA